MKKRLICFLSFVLLSFVFTFPSGAEESNNLFISDLPVVCSSSKFSGTPNRFYSIYQNYQDYSVNGLLTVLPLVKINGEWCYLSDNSGNYCSNIRFGFVDNKFHFYSYSFSLDSDGFTNFNCEASLSFSSSTLYLLYQNSVYASTPVSISSGSSVSVSSLPDTICWAVMGTDYTDFSDSNTLSYLRGKNVQNSDVSEKFTYTSSSAEIITAPQSEIDKADGGHLKVSQSQAANGYTAFSFMLNDNENYHDYSVKISSNTNQIGTIEQRILNENGGSIDTGSETLSDIASVSNWLNTMFNVWSENIVAMQHFDFEYMFNQNAQTDSALRNLNKSWLSSMCKNMNSLTYSTAKVLTCDELTFTDDKLPYLPCKVVSFALSDYINVNKDTIYKVEIIDNVTQTVLDYTYIATPVAMVKGAENYGIKVYSYKDYETMKNDVLNNDPSNAYTSNTGDKLEDSDPDNGFNSGTIQGIYDEYSINDLSDALSESVSNASGFVRMCTSLIPPEIMALIVGGIALLVLLRVLGR